MILNEDKCTFVNGIYISLVKATICYAKGILTK